MTEKPRRDPSVVIRAVRDVVPNKHKKLRKLLERAAADAGFHAPESPTPWMKLRDILEGYIGKPSEGWQFKVIEVVQTHPGIRQEEKGAES